MFLRRIDIYNYKNYSQATAEFRYKFNLINGFNGSGKTNLIDAIHYLCLCKSYFTRSDADIVRHGETSFRLEGNFALEETETSIVCKFYNPKKEFQRDGLTYERLSDHIGLLPVVMIAPDDIEMINDGPEVRRRFIDTAISQVNHPYLQKLIQYNKVLQQRNTLLKQASLSGGHDATLLHVLNSQLAPLGDFLYQERKNYLEAFIPAFTEIYTAMAGDTEGAGIRYISQLEDQSHLHLLMNSLREDLEAQRTGAGIHKDDILLLLNEFPVRDTGSQGQIKSYLIAMKLAQFKIMRSATGKTPVLLLDDVFEKLDKKRLRVLFGLLQTDDFTQIFITDADEHRSVEFFEENVELFGHFHVTENNIQ